MKLYLLCASVDKAKPKGERALALVAADSADEARRLLDSPSGAPVPASAAAARRQCKRGDQGVLFKRSYTF